MKCDGSGLKATGLQLGRYLRALGVWAAVAHQDVGQQTMVGYVMIGYVTWYKVMVPNCL